MKTASFRGINIYIPCTTVAQKILTELQDTDACDVLSSYPFFKKTVTKYTHKEFQPIFTHTHTVSIACSSVNDNPSIINIVGWIQSLLVMLLKKEECIFHYSQKLCRESRDFNAQNPCGMKYAIKRGTRLDWVEKVAGPIQ